MPNRLLTLVLLIVWCVVVAGPAAAASLIVDEDGLLRGARGVLVEGIPHDIEFVDGRCVDLSLPCDEDDDFLFPSEAAARAAADALLQQVFVDGPLGDFDSDPGLTWGCDPVAPSCQARTIWSRHWNVPGSLDLMIAFNRHEYTGLENVVGPLFSSVNFDTTSPHAGSAVYVRWTVVPEPGPSILVGLGLAGLAQRAGRRA